MNKRISRALIIVLAIFLAYPVIGNVLIFTGAAHTLANIKPEKLTMSWDSAWTLIPGRFSVEGLRFQSTTPRNQFALVVDSGQVVFSLTGFLSRTVDITQGRGDGVEVDYAKVKAETNSAVNLSSSTSPSTIASSSTGSAGNAQATDAAGIKPPWTIRLDNIKATNIRKVTIRNLSGVEDMEFIGKGQLDDLKMSIVTKGGLMQVDRALGSMTIASQTGAENIDAPLAVKFTGQIEAKGNLASIGSAEFLPDRNLNLSVGGEGDIDALLIIDKGELKSGSRLSFDSDALQTTFLNFRSVGQGQIAASVDDQRERPVEINIEVEQFKLLKEDSDVDYLEGTDLTIHAAAPRFKLYSQALEENSAFSFNIAEGRVSDITHYNEFIMPGANLQLIAGTATTKGGLEINNGVAKGEIEISGTDVTVSTGSREIETDLRLIAKLSEGDFETRRFRLKDSSLRFENVRLETEARQTDENWWGELIVERGALVWKKPLEVSGKAALRMLDVEPLIAMVRDPSKKETKLDEFLNVKNVEGRLLVESHDQKLSIDPLHIDSQGLEIISRMTLSRESIDGRLYAKFKKVAANFEIVNRRLSAT
ncbi:MAG: hypothetical protein EBU28_06455 [Gammaproteobacteria bacterium]|nr:hypothetical protein [Gammaproteobacteria bacterium]